MARSTRGGQLPGTRGPLDLVGAKSLGERRHLRVARGDVVAVSGLEAEAAAVPEGDRPDPVPLELEAVALLGGRDAGGKLGRHRVDHRRHPSGPHRVII